MWIAVLLDHSSLQNALGRVSPVKWKGRILRRSGHDKLGLNDRLIVRANCEEVYNLQTGSMEQFLVLP